MRRQGLFRPNLWVHYTKKPQKIKLFLAGDIEFITIAAPGGFLAQVDFA
jgi:hypothetical protein